MVKSSPTDLWGHMAVRTARLETAVALLSVTVLILSGWLAWSLWRGTAVYFIPPGGPGLAQPGVIPDAYALDMASRVLTRRFTFTPATIKAVHNDIRTALHPTLATAFGVQAERELIVVKEKQLASQVAIETAVVTGRTAHTVTIAVDGIRSVFVGAMLVREEPLHAEITLTPWLTTGTPTGLVVLKVTTTPPLAP